MHDPQTVAFEIPMFWRKKSEFGYRPSLVTIWHVDPERDGTDDSCGWFMRSRHGSKDVLKKIESRFSEEWSRQFALSDGTTAELGLFDGTPYQWPVMSAHGLAINLFFYAAYVVFGSRDKAMRFIKRNLVEILFFAENPTDSMHTGFWHKFGIDEREKQEDRIHSTAVMIYGWILRASRPWYQHPRWHIWHWKLQVHPLQEFKRWAFSRCCKCGTGFEWGESPVSHSWDGTGPLWFRSEQHIYHSNCSSSQRCKSAQASRVGTR